MRITHGFFPLAAAICMGFLAGGAFAETRPHEGSPEGRALYLRKCAACHGSDGDGRGPAARGQQPRPRDFVRGSYRFRSTPTGQLPTDEDLLRTVSRGIPGTTMPAWKGELGDAQMREVITVVKGFSIRFSKAPPPRPIPIPPAAPTTPSSVRAGRVVYERMQCATCHGATGRGDGKAAKTLVDESGDSCRPCNFTLPGRMKGGDTPQDVYRTFTTGMDGTPMPAFTDQLTATERWQLVHFVRSLAEVAIPVEARVRTLTADRWPRVPSDPMDPLWEEVGTTTVPVRSLEPGPLLESRVFVSAVRSSTDLALLVQWPVGRGDIDSPTAAGKNDEVTIYFPMTRGGTSPSTRGPVLDSCDARAPLSLWQWRASSGPPSKRDRQGSAQESNAAGLGPSVAQTGRRRHLSGQGTTKGELQRVVLRRSLATSDSRDVQLQGAVEVPIAFAVGDSSRRGEKGQRLHSAWQFLRFGP